MDLFRASYIHPFPGGSGRVSRLMSRAMASRAGISAHDPWSLARGLKSRTEYKSMLDAADASQQGDLGGRGNLSPHALTACTWWFLSA